MLDTPSRDETFRRLADFVDPQPDRPGLDDSRPSQGNSDVPADTPEADDDEPPPAAGDPSVLAACAQLDHSDTSNGERLRAHFGDDLCVLQVEGAKSSDYIVWVDTHWDAATGNDHALRLAQRVGGLIKAEVPHMVMKRGEKPIEFAARCGRRIAFGTTSRNSGRLASMLSCAAPHLARHPDAFNADPLRLATLSHTLRFSVLAPGTADAFAEVVALPGHDRADLITKIVPVEYDEKAVAPRWTAFLKRFLPVAEVRECVQTFAGAGLLGVPLQAVLFHYGDGANGKSVFMETLCRVMGPIAVDLPAESLVGTQERAGSGPSPDLARLYGARTVRVPELPRGVPLREELVKKLTGGERLPVRNMYKGFFDFRPVFKAHLSGNDYPQVDGTDDGIWRRLNAIHWPVKIPEEERRPFEDVVGEFVAEAPGILNWLADGAIRFLQSGFVPPPAVVAATKDYRDEMDPIGQFVEDCVRAAPGETVAARAMYDAYCAWSCANAKKPIFETRFGRVMKTKLKRDDSRIRQYVDVALHEVPAKPRQIDDAERWERMP